MTCQSAIFTHLTESLAGAATIRAFKHEDRFNQKAVHLITNYNRCMWSSLNSHRWLGN